jgi:GH24 family phage-related lysozyme (muramidase)
MGDYVGKLGTTGGSTGPHLDIRLRKAGAPRHREDTWIKLENIDWKGYVAEATKTNSPYEAVTNNLSDTKNRVGGAVSDFVEGAIDKFSGVSKRGFNMIKSFEAPANLIGKGGIAYDYDYGNHSGGYGTQLKPHERKKGFRLSEHEANKRLKHSVAQKMIHVNLLDTRRRLAGKPKLNQNQRDALASFYFNLGTGQSAALDKLIASGQDAAAAKQMLKYNKAGGKVLAGLAKRRKAEAALYSK